MTKKKSSKRPKEVKENKDVVKEEKPPSVKKEGKSEIDEIFAGKKRKKSIAEKPKSDGSDRPKKMKSRKESEEKESKDGGVPSRPRKRTADGFTIFTEEELGVGNADAGGTPLCPFDCSCCF